MNDHSIFQKYDVVLFDLDNTLYAEKDYLHSAYRSIGLHLNQLNGRLDSKKIADFLINTFDQYGREQLFNKLIDQFQIKEAGIDQFLNWMREVALDEKLVLYPTSHELLLGALAHSKVFVITNGNVRQQENKVNQIDWCGLRKHIDIIYANATQPKPDPASFRSLNIATDKKCLYIGDTESDQLFAKNCGIDFQFIQSFF